MKIENLELVMSYIKPIILREERLQNILQSISRSARIPLETLNTVEAKALLGFILEKKQISQFLIS